MACSTQRTSRPGSRIAFTTDKGLIAGAELKFSRATLRFSWRDAIANAQRELSQT